MVEAGRVVERGTHDELLDAGGRYAALYRTQFADADEPVDEPAELPTLVPNSRVPNSRVPHRAGHLRAVR